jgi:hypothetical protein
VTPRRGKRYPPAPGGESFEAEDLGEPVYKVPVPPAKSVIRAVPAERGELFDAGEPPTPEQARAYREQHGIPQPNRPLVPTAAEVAKLPRSARTAFARRCAERVAPLLADDRPTELDPESAARLILAAATVQTSLTRQLRRLRRDFDRLVYLSKKHPWTDETPILPTVFGPMWAADAMPDWARQPPPAGS